MHEIDFSKGSHRCHISNPHAMAFVPLNKLDKHDDVITIITAFLMTILLLIGSYNPHKESIKNHLNNTGKELNDLCLKYETFILIGGFQF